MTQKNESRWHPLRTCLGCRKTRNKEEMIRIVRLPDGHPEVDPLQKKSGRGAYLCRDAECLKRAFRSRAISRSLGVSLPEEIKKQLLEEIGNDG